MQTWTNSKIRSEQSESERADFLRPFFFWAECAVLNRQFRQSPRYSGLMNVRYRQISPSATDIYSERASIVSCFSNRSVTRCTSVGRQWLQHAPLSWRLTMYSTERQTDTPVELIRIARNNWIPPYHQGLRLRRIVLLYAVTEYTVKWNRCSNWSLERPSRCILHRLQPSITVLLYKEITLSLRWPRDAPNMWVPWKL